MVVVDQSLRIGNAPGRLIPEPDYTRETAPRARGGKKILDQKLHACTVFLSGGTPMRKNEHIRDQLIQVFSEKQADVLTHVVTEAYDKLARSQGVWVIRKGRLLSQAS